MYVPGSTKAPSQPPSITIDDTALKFCREKFYYLGSTVCYNGSLDAEIALRISKPALHFGRLGKCLWYDKCIRICTKITTYKAVVLSALLYCSETWTTCSGHIRQLEQFHQGCLRTICNIRWQDRIKQRFKVCAARHKGTVHTARGNSLWIQGLATI